MTLTLKSRATLAAAVAVCCIAAPATAAKKQAAQSSLRAIQIECMKQYGAYEDPQTKRLVMSGGLVDMQGKFDAIYACVEQKTGRKPEPFIRQDLKSN